jgi:hypothetical protein
MPMEFRSYVEKYPDDSFSAHVMTLDIDGPVSGIFYPYKVIVDAIEEYRKVIFNGYAVGEIKTKENSYYHSRTINLAEVSHKIFNCSVHKNKVFVRFNLLNTPCGIKARELFKADKKAYLIASLNADLSDDKKTILSCSIVKFDLEFE